MTLLGQRCKHQAHRQGRPGQPPAGTGPRRNLPLLRGNDPAAAHPKVGRPVLQQLLPDLAEVAVCPNEHPSRDAGAVQEAELHACRVTHDPAWQPACLKCSAGLCKVRDQGSAQAAGLLCCADL